MKTSNDYLDMAIEITGSDRQTAIRLGITAPSLCQARKRGSMKDDHCVELAGILGINPAAVLMELNTGRLDRLGWGKWEIRGGELYHLDLNPKYYTWRPGELLAQRLVGVDPSSAEILPIAARNVVSRGHDG